MSRHETEKTCSAHTLYHSASCNISKPTKYGKVISVSFDTNVIQSRCYQVYRIQDMNTEGDSA